MRTLAVAVLLVGCRLNFDPLTDEGDGGTGGGGSGSGILVDANVGSGSGAGSTGTPCYGINDSSTFDDGSSTGTDIIIAIRLTAPSSLRVTRAEAVTGDQVATSSIGLWSHNAGTNAPLANLTTAPFQVDVPPAWYGADFTTPVQFNAGTSFWVAWTVGATPLQSSIDVGVPGSVYPDYRPSTDGGASWAPNFPIVPWKVRLFCEGGG